MNNINIRPYNNKDRSALRTLCCDVADRGESIENFFPDREWAADLLTKYYTDYEPASTFVADCDGQLVGYINGCLDNRRHGLVMFWLLGPLVLAKGFKRGVFFSPQFLQMAQGALKNWRRLLVWRKKSFHSHQGHLHIGVSGQVRGRQVGQRLVEALVDYSRKSGIGTLTASVHGGNTAATAFFEKLGFTVRERHSMIMVRDGKEEPYQSLLYVKTINAH